MFFLILWSVWLVVEAKECIGLRFGGVCSTLQACDCFPIKWSVSQYRIVRMSDHTISQLFQIDDLQSSKLPLQNECRQRGSCPFEAPDWSIYLQKVNPIQNLSAFTDDKKAVDALKLNFTNEMMNVFAYLKCYSSNSSTGVLCEIATDDGLGLEAAAAAAGVAEETTKPGQIMHVLLVVVNGFLWSLGFDSSISQVRLQEWFASSPQVETELNRVLNSWLNACPSWASQLLACVNLAGFIWRCSNKLNIKPTDNQNLSWEEQKCLREGFRRIG